MRVISVKEITGALSHLFYPVLCEGCQKPLIGDEYVLCMGCEAQLPETGFQYVKDNEAEQRFAGRINFVHATSFAYFIEDGIIQHLVHGLKYKGRQDTGRYLGYLLGKRLLETEWIDDINIIIPVPLHPAKEAARGYNQSLLIAEGISRAVNRPTSSGLLLRIKKTESQTNKTRTERVNNMEGAFWLAQKEAVKRMHILLIDDVLTTGATLEACALALLGEESVKISIATIGIAVS